MCIRLSTFYIPLRERGKLVHNTVLFLPTRQAANNRSVNTDRAIAINAVFTTINLKELAVVLSIDSDTLAWRVDRFFGSLAHGRLFGGT